MIAIFLAIVSCVFASESSYPYISGYTWWHYADWKLTNPDYGKSTYSRFSPDEVKLGDTIFVEYNCLEEFARDYLPKIQNKVILITGNYGYRADMPLPGPYGFLLEDVRIAAWFVQNIDRAPTEKLIPMPIGLASNYWPHGNHLALDAILPKALKNEKRPTPIYMNFSLSPERQICVEALKRLGLELPEKRKSYVSYLNDLSKSVFVVSPPGGGVDCHRTWEALLLGCYPIVLSNTLNPLYEDLPVVIIPNWETLTWDFLRQKEEELKKGTYRREKLYFSYWTNEIEKIQESLRGVSQPFFEKIKAHIQSNSWKEAYYDLLPKIINEQGVQSILEVGVALGGHAEEILKKTNIHEYIGVDPYAPYDPEDQFQVDVDSYRPEGLEENFDALHLWVSSYRLSPYQKRAKILRMDSFQAAQMIEDESLDCIFIDGDHRYVGVMKDLRALYPKLKRGHLMIGDDYTMPPVKQAVDEFFSELGIDLFFFTAQSGYKLWAVYKS